MKIKVRDTVYDGEKEPVMIILSKGEKEQITNMDPSAKKYCVYPDTEGWTSNNHEKIKKWMKEVINHKHLYKARRVESITRL